MKIIINKCYGGFGLSDEAFEWLIENKKWTVTHYKNRQYEDENADIVEGITSFSKYNLVGWDSEIRDNPDLIECIETLGKKADGEHAVLKIVDIPDGMEYTIEEYDGIEWIAEKHETWG